MRSCSILGHWMLWRRSYWVTLAYLYSYNIVLGHEENKINKKKTNSTPESVMWSDQVEGEGKGSSGHPSVGRDHY